jgi:hypothetical protein
MPTIRKDDVGAAVRIAIHRIKKKMKATSRRL